MLGATQVFVTDNEAYVWKRLSFERDIFGPTRSRPTVWYADAPRLHSPADDAIENNYCAMHVFHDMRGVNLTERKQMQVRVHRTPCGVPTSRWHVCTWLYRRPLTDHSCHSASLYLSTWDSSILASRSDSTGLLLRPCGAHRSTMRSSRPSKHSPSAFRRAVPLLPSQSCSPLMLLTSTVLLAHFKQLKPTLSC